MNRKQYASPSISLVTLHIRNGLMEGSMQLNLKSVDDTVSNDDGSTQYGKGSTPWGEGDNDEDLW